jgi:serine/threonine-protein kinase HipA
MATTTSDRVFVWCWLPGQTEPVPAGVLERRNGSEDLSFRYGNRYVERADAISLYAPQLPLQAETWFGATENLKMPGCLRDASPDSWGRRVIANRMLGSRFAGASTDISESDYLLQSSSNRLGAVDFQHSPTEYLAREETASLDDLQRAAQIIQAGDPLPSALGAALLGGTAIGGARPKALLRDGDTQLIAKFSTSDDVLDMVGAEAASIHLARAVGIEVTGSSITNSLGRKVLLLERFDRAAGGVRRMVVSGLTMLGLPETFMPLGSYPDLLDVLRRDGRPGPDLGETVFKRVAFNMLISNTDDHLRNHAAFWDGRHVELTPAYDLSPSPRTGDTASQALAYGADGQRESNLASLIAVCHLYDLSVRQATDLVLDMASTIEAEWEEAADAGQLTRVDRESMWSKQFLNPGTLYGVR